MSIAAISGILARIIITILGYFGYAVSDDIEAELATAVVAGIGAVMTLISVVKAIRKSKKK